MAKRLYLCDIVGTGDEFDPYRPAVADLGVSWVGSIPTHPAGHPQHGHPVHTWALVLVAAKDHAALRKLTGVDPLPDFPLDGKVSAINAATKGQMKAALVRRGLNADSLVDAKDGFREVVRGIGQALDPVFDENKFDVTDV